MRSISFFFFQAEDGIRDGHVTGVQTCALPIYHPKMTKAPKRNYQILKRDDQFVGCTLILNQDYPTAIVDLGLYKDYASLYSIIVHELFHGFQYIQKEKRFADEILGITYPLIKENVELRNQERSYLYRAVLEKDRIKKKQLLTTFITLRSEERRVGKECRFRCETDHHIK